MLAQVPWGIPEVVSDTRHKDSWGHIVLNLTASSAVAHQFEISATSTARADQNLVAAQTVTAFQLPLVQTSVLG